MRAHTAGSRRAACSASTRGWQVVNSTLPPVGVPKCIHPNHAARSTASAQYRCRVHYVDPTTTVLLVQRQRLDSTANRNRLTLFCVFAVRARGRGAGSGRADRIAVHGSADHASCEQARHSVRVVNCGYVCCSGAIESAQIGPAMRCISLCFEIGPARHGTARFGSINQPCTVAELRTAGWARAEAEAEVSRSAHLSLSLSGSDRQCDSSRRSPLHNWSDSTLLDVRRTATPLCAAVQLHAAAGGGVHILHVQSNARQSAAHVRARAGVALPAGTCAPASLFTAVRLWPKREQAH